MLASDLGLSVNQIANIIRPLIAGDDVTTEDEHTEPTMLMFALQKTVVACRAMWQKYGI